MIIVAAIFEVLWVIGLKYAGSPLEWIVTIAAIFLSFSLMIKAGEKIPVGTVYAVFVGLGTVGTLTVDSIFFGTPVTISKICLMLILVIGIIGLKQTTQLKESND